MSIYHLERGGHADMKRIYPMMEFDFHDWERPKHLECQRALLRGAELLLLKNAQNAECGYALMLKNNMTGYALLGWLAVYPHVRGNGVGGEFLSLIREYYEGWQGLLLEVTEYPQLEKARKLHAFYGRNGYADVNCAYSIYGEPSALMYRRLAGPEDISGDIRAVMRECYLPLYGDAEQARYIDIK